MVDKKLVDDLVHFVSKNSNNFEVSEFDGDIFWLNNMAFSYAAEKLRFSHMLIYHIPGKFLSVYDKTRFEAIGKRFFDKYKDDHDSFRKKFYSTQENLIKLAAKLRLDDESLSSYNKLVTAIGDFSEVSVFSLEALEHHLNKRIKSRIKEYDVFELLTTPLYSSYVSRRQLELIKALGKLPDQEKELVKTGQSDISRYSKLPSILNDYLSRWGWSFLNYGSNSMLNPEELLKMIIEDYSSFEGEDARHKAFKSRQHEKRKMLSKLTKDIRELIDFFDLVVELRDQRKAVFLKIILPSKEWLKAFARSKGLSYEEVIFLDCQEHLLLTKHNQEEMLEKAKSRSKGCVAVFSFKGNHSIILVGKDYLRLKEAILRPCREGSLSGVSTSGGIVKGKVRVIKDLKEFESFCKGEILVASHTTPDYIKVMKKASAIITERGGITSHAAIVSRELGIPCIVGIRNVTETLKTGDLVEVDADNGIVKKIRQDSSVPERPEVDAAELFANDMKGQVTIKQEGNLSGLAFASIIPGFFSPYSSKYYDFDFRSLIIVLKPHYGAVFFDKAIYQETTNTTYRHLQQKKSASKLLEIKDFKLIEKYINADYRKYSPKQLARLTDTQLDALMKKFFNRVDRFIACTVFSESLDASMIRRFYDLVSKDDAGFDGFLRFTTKVCEESFAARYERVMIDFGLRDYDRQWIFANYYEAPELAMIREITEKSIRSMGGRLKIKTELSNAKQELRRNRSELSSYTKKLDKELRILAEFIQLCIGLRDLRKEAIQKHITLLSNTAREILKRKGISHEKVPFVFESDFRTGRHNEKDYADELERRYNGCALYFNRKSLVIQYIGFDEAKKKLFSLVDKDAISSQELHGTSACKGKVKSKVSIVLGEKDFSKFKQGEILVTSMTRPEYLPLMKKAAGVITDEGGVTCHAAIVSRELGIPCVIGTNNATRVLKDGDLVEVDANNGVVRIMEKNDNKKNKKGAESERKNAKKAEKNAAKAASQKKSIIATELKGTTINPGLVFGRARIVKLASETSKVKIGDVLVTRMTTPKFRKAMEKAIAIVTDEGDANCHAADVSREMSKPCIISTVIATKTFKDGDYLEVDASKGIVRKITAVEFKKKIKEVEDEAALVGVSKIPTGAAELEIRPDMVAWFKDLSKKDLPLVGGKGANLGEMFNHFPIPNGFCITVNAYKKFLKDNKLEEGIFSLLRKLDIEDTKLLDEVSVKIDKIIMSAKISVEIEEEIIRNYRVLGSGFVAVRSSATAEDLPTASFAGQQATFLNVKGEKDILVAVKQCWASLFTARAIYYRVINEFHHEKVLISVVVQEMVDSDKAGVMFTVNPVNNNRNEMIIEGSFGLGESVVSGQVTPDTYIIEKSPLKMQSKTVNEKRMAIIKDEKTGKNKEIALDSVKANTQCLKDSEIIDLAKAGLLIEQHYAKPQDIEWAVDRKGKIFILQSRPITTLDN